ncbi:cardiolipin synthase [Stenotrophomonas rhizophila]|uniref:cardiolipin synthase n=1 Tax=Stenotrophomonas rhizophila TaxID=216778 RepID=UPI001E5E4843|nr:cardiolipin synthase [Stenotrophomonas rhizophila]MCC7633325.1 cardiolipin synthase [Stenotrophomonas rhizophila]MCC7662216.1 cardiolipin synthase [Stenotrophomonas rhizophila]
MPTTYFALTDWLDAVPHLRPLLVIAYLLYLLWLTGWIMLQKREPVATLSWILSLAALPYLGLFIYYLLGPQKVKRQRLRRGRARSGMEHYSSVCPPDADCTELAKIAQATTGLAPSSATEVEWLVDGAATYRALLAAIAQARDHVHVEYYIFNPDHAGTALRDALVERARAGVRVRLLLDAVGSSLIRKRFLQPLLEAGGEVAWFHPRQLLKPFKRPWMNMRTHRKLVVVDGRVAFTGGINITDEEDESRRPDAYRDLHMRLTGHVVRSLQLVFVEDWIYATGQEPARLEIAPLWPHDVPSRQEGRIHAQVLVSGPDSSWETIHRLQVAAIHEARERVWLVTPYFVPGEAARMALTSAALGGLDVRLLVPKMSDSWFVTQAARSYFDELLQAGVKIYEYGPRMLHTKAFIADREVCIVGSANFDHRSFRLNFELSMMLVDADRVAALEQILAAEFDASVRVHNERQRSLWRHRVPEAFARLASPLL